MSCLAPNADDYRRPNGTVKTAAYSKAMAKYNRCVKTLARQDARTVGYEEGFDTPGAGAVAGTFGAIGDAFASFTGGAPMPATAPVAPAPDYPPWLIPAALVGVVALVMMK